MKRQVGLVRTSVLSVLLSSAALVFTGALAQAADMPVKAVAKPVPYWWFHGTVEAGGRFFLNDPNRDGKVYEGERSLAKYYEYTDVAPGALANADIALGTSDGIYEIDAGGKNMGYEDQRYYLDYSEAGRLYINGGYDETPHVYSTSAQTFYQGVGTTNLTLPSGFTKCASGDSTCIQNAVDNYTHRTDLGIRRDTASGNLRWTPDTAWDIRANYSHMHRHGTQVDGVTGFASAYPEGPTQVPRPVDDVTQNYGLNGEYAGTSPWGQRMTIKLAYNGSNYDDAFTSYSIEDPFTNGTAQPARLSTWPSNRADAVSGTVGLDLPWKSRYVGHVSYDMMRQNADFIPMSTGGSYTLPQASLDGKINTLLSDNILTTQLTPELTSKLSYRYYDFENDTPELYFPNLLSYDSATCGTECKTLNSLAMQYTKQNAGVAVNWRPSRHWNVGGAYGWQHYSWHRADVNATNENSGKVHVDWMPTSWFTVRSSGYYAARRYDNYDYYGYVGDFNFGNVDAYAENEGYSAAYRQFFLDNRDRWKANVGIDLVVVPGVTVSPSFKYQDDHYDLDPALEEGMRDSRSYSTGVDVTYLINPTTSLTVGYLREFATQLVYNCSCGGHNDNNAVPANNPSKFLQTNDRIVVDTFTGLLRWAAIPDKLDLGLRYTLSHGKDHQQLWAITGTTPIGFPDDTTWYQRLDATAVYTFDKDTVAALGWKGKVKAKLHYVWERNAVANWQNDTVMPYNGSLYGSQGANAIFMGYDNPNYNVHMLMASLAFTW